MRGSIVSTAVLLLLLGHAGAGSVGRVSGGYIRPDDRTERLMRRAAASMVDETLVQKRKEVSTQQTDNATEWNSQTSAACLTALSSLNGKASNPSGTSICYNLPTLDNTTGVFQADLRLYRISEPTGDFAGIPSEDVQVGLTYQEATVSPINASTLSARGEAGDAREPVRTSLISWPRSLDDDEEDEEASDKKTIKTMLMSRAESRGEEFIEKRNASTAAPTLIKTFAFVGQINKNLLTANMNTSSIQALLIPVVTLRAVNSSGSTVNTTLSSTEATFVSGVFSKGDAAASASTTKSSGVAPNAANPSLNANGVFIVPGTHIRIFPIGAIITGIWAVLGFATITYGTIGRMRFREQFRSRAARAAKGDQARI